ncbi:MAG: hypothetical protein JO278_10085, partial [Dyella sp.]|nr:hypothetical protein [Dyella sp.]
MTTDNQLPEASSGPGQRPVVMFQWRHPSRLALRLIALFILLAICAFGLHIRADIKIGSAVHYGAGLAAILFAGYLGIRIHAAFDAMRRNVAALRQTNAQLSSAQALSQTGSLVLDLGANSLTWSEQTARILGLPTEVPPTIDLLLGSVHEADREMVLEMLEDARRGALRVKMAHRVEWSNGSVRHVRFLAARSTDSAGDVVYYG